MELVAIEGQEIEGVGAGIEDAPALCFAGAGGDDGFVSPLTQNCSP